MAVIADTADKRPVRGLFRAHVWDPLAETIAEAYRKQYYPLGYTPALDGLRGLMAIVVMVAHVYSTVLPVAMLVMDLFFVMSGYFITSLLVRDIQRHGSIRYGEFYRRRFARILPPLLVMLLAYLLFRSIFVPPFRDALVEAAIVFTYITNWWLVFDPSGIFLLPHTWSLAVEEQFYLLWPITFAAARAYLRRSLAPRLCNRSDRACRLGMDDLAHRDRFSLVAALPQPGHARRCAHGRVRLGCGAQARAGRRLSEGRTVLAQAGLAVNGLAAHRRLLRHPVFRFLRPLFLFLRWDHGVWGVAGGHVGHPARAYVGDRPRPRAGTAGNRVSRQDFLWHVSLACSYSDFSRDVPPRIPYHPDGSAEKSGAGLRRVPADGADGDPVVCLYRATFHARAQHASAAGDGSAELRTLAANSA